MHEAATLPVPLLPEVAPLTRRASNGQRLRRSIGVEREIATVLELPASQLRERAKADGGNPDRLSSECLVYLIRQDLRRGSRRLADELTPLLLARCDASLRGSIRGFDAATARDAREEVLGRLALSLLEGDEADFLEVRFALALKRLRIDVCRKARRRLQRRVELGTSEDDETVLPLERLQTQRARQEDRLLIRQALATLGAAEREVLVLHRLAGLPLRSRVPSRGGLAKTDLVRLLGRSERTLRNRLRRAERQLAAFRETPDDR